MFLDDVDCSRSWFGLMFTPWFHVHIDPRLIRRFQGIIFSNIQGEAGSKVTTEECEGEGDG